MDELADRIIGPMQGEGMDDEVVAFGGEREGVSVLDKVGVGKPAAPNVGETSDNRHIRKVPVNHAETILNVVSDEVLQEHAPIQICTLAVAQEGCAVGHFWGRFSHGRYLG